MSVFDIEQIKRELSVYDPLEPCMIKAIRTIILLCEEGQKLEKQRDWLTVFIEDNLDCDMCPYSKGACTPQIPADCAERIKKAAEEAVR